MINNVLQTNDSLISNSPSVKTINKLSLLISVDFFKYLNTSSKLVPPSLLGINNSSSVRGLKESNEIINERYK